MKKIITTALLLSIAYASFSQQSIQPMDPNLSKTIPDKVFELGIPLLLIYALLNGLLQFFKTHSNNKLKSQAIEKGVPHDVLLKIFSDDKKQLRLNAMKWVFVLSGIGFSMLIVQFIPFGFASFGIVFLFTAVGNFLYYSYLKREQ